MMIDYIINIFLPSAVEVFSVCCILGMLRETYQDSKWKIAVIVIGLSCLITVLDIIHIDVNVGVNTFLIAALLLPLYALRPTDAIFDAICVTVAYCSLQMLLLLVISLFEESLLQDDNFISVAITIMAVGIFALTKIDKLVLLSQKNYDKFRDEARWVFLNLFIIYMVYMMEWNKSYYQFGSQKPLFVISILFIILSNSLLMFQIMKSKKQQQELLKQQELDAMREDFLDQMAAKQHEFSKHLQVIKGLSENEGAAYEEIEEYINGLIEKRESEAKTVYTGDGAISALLSEKQKEALDRKVSFDTLIKKPLPAFPCSRYELIEIMGNLINNAFDAVEGLEDADKKVFLEIGSTGENVYLQVMNGLPPGFSLDMDQMMQKGFSTKRGGVRGFGLHNTKKIVEENHGRMEISINGELILMRLLF